MSDDSKKVSGAPTLIEVPVYVRKPTRDIIPTVSQVVTQIRPRGPENAPDILPRDTGHDQSHRFSRARSSMGTLEDGVRAELASAQRDGNVYSRKRAGAAGAALHIDHALANEMRCKDQEKRGLKFDKAIEAARFALSGARAFVTQLATDKAIERFWQEIHKAIKLDPKERSENQILKLLGTSRFEMEMLPTLFFTTVTIKPGNGTSIATWGARELRKRSAKTCPRLSTITVVSHRGRTKQVLKQVEVIYFGERPFEPIEPIRQIICGQRIDAPRTKIIARKDGAYCLELDSARYLMRRERSHVVDDTLVGDDWWLYYRLDSNGTYDSTSPLLRVFTPHTPHENVQSPSGFMSNPPSGGALVMEKNVDEPLFVIMFEHGCHQVAMATVLLKTGKVKTTEVPWHNDLFSAPLVSA